MAVPEEIRSVLRPTNTVVIDTGRKGPKRYAVRERSYIKYVAGGNPQPRNGSIIGHIIDGKFVSTAADKSTSVITRLANVPEELKKNGEFCLWRYEQIDGRKAKIPYNPNYTSSRAATNRPETFTSYSRAVEVLKENQDSFDGIGIRVSGDFVGIDLDKIEFNEKGELKGAAGEIVAMLDAYTELSPSGKGLRIFCKAKDLNFDRVRYYFMHNNIEIYIPGYTNRYLTVTGNVLKKRNLLADRSEQLKEILDKYMTR